MKIAKRALVLIMAVAMVCCMSAMAFAAGSVSLSYDGDKNISITANGMIGLKSFDFVVTADDGVVIKNLKKSSDAAACEAGDNAFTTDFNKSNGKFSGYFKEDLWALDAWKAAADDLGEEIPDGFNPSAFNMGTIVIDASGATGPAYVYVTGSVKGCDATVDAKVLVKEGEAPVTEAPKTEAPKTEAPKTEAPKTEAPKTEAPKTEAPKTEAPKTEAPKTEAPKTEAPKTEAPKTEAPKTEAPKTEAAPTTVKPVDTGDSTPNAGDKPTGDNMALAAAASVVALAGAAFVITKKRK